jgi:acyl homoserine lactone synthase
MHLSFGRAASLPIADMQDLFAYRYSVFVDRLKWDLPDAKPGFEADQFDRADTFHVMARDDAGELCGCARLLPTTRPYLLGSIFPELMEDSGTPRSSDVWEVSRFCAVDVSQDSGVRTRQADIWGCREVMAATVRCAIELGARRLIGVSVLSIERILTRLAVDAYRAGPVMDIGGHRVFAFWLDINQRTLNALGISSDEPYPVINTRFCKSETLAYSCRRVA